MRRENVHILKLETKKTETMTKNDPIIRLLLSASLGLAIALNTLDGQSILFLDDTIYTNQPRNMFFGLVFVLILLSGAALFHVLVHEVQLTRSLATMSLFFSIIILPIPFAAHFPDPYKMVSLLLVFCQLPVPFLVERLQPDETNEPEIRWKSGNPNVYLKRLYAIP